MLSHAVTRRILVLDPDPDMLALVTVALVSRGYEVLASRSDELGQVAMWDQLPDLVIIDTATCDMSALLRRIYTCTELVGVPLVFLTERADASVRRRIHGSNACVSKPVDPRELSLRVAGCLVRSSRLFPRASTLSGGVLLQLAT